MKLRVIKQKGFYYPQAKPHWWSRWGYCFVSDNLKAVTLPSPGWDRTGMCSTLEEAKLYLRNYEIFYNYGGSSKDYEVVYEKQKRCKLVI